MIIPAQQFVNSVDLVICDTAEGIGEPGLRFNVIELGCFNQGKGILTRADTQFITHRLVSF